MERFATGAWLDRRVLRFAGCAGLLWTLATIARLWAGRGGPAGTLAANGQPLGTDFTLIWTAGRLALGGQAAAVYDWGALEAAEHATHGVADFGFLGWHYPPVFLLFAAAVAALPYLPALVLWQAATLGAALLALRRILPDRVALLAGAGAPAVLVCLLHGQNAFLSAALLGFGLVLLPGRPVLAGLCLGALGYKPHLALVVPVALVAAGHWRALLAAGASAAGLALVSVALFGTEPWRAFLATSDLTRAIVLEAGGTGWYKIGSAFAYCRMIGGSVALAYGVQALVTAGAVAATAWLWRSRAAHALKAAGLALAALLATPYLLDYDLVVGGVAIAFLAAHGRRAGFRRWEATALALAWLSPFGARYLAYWTNLPVAFLSVAVPFILCIGRAAAETGAAPRTAPA